MREAAIDCIEELHQQLGQPVLDRLQHLNVKPAQLKELHTRLERLAVSSEAVQDFPLFQAVTAKPVLGRLGSMTSRSDSSTQVSSTQISCTHLALPRLPLPASAPPRLALPRLALPEFTVHI